MEPPHSKKLGDLVPEGGFAGGEERVLAGVPAEKVRRAGVRGVVLAGFPDFVEEEGTRLIYAAVQVVLQAALLLAGRGDQGAQFGFKEQVLAFLGLHNDNQSNRVFRELGDGGALRAATGAALRRLARFRLGHDGGDCTPNAGQSKGN